MGAEMLGGSVGDPLGDGEGGGVSRTIGVVTGAVERLPRSALTERTLPGWASEKQRAVHVQPSCLPGPTSDSRAEQHRATDPVIAGRGGSGFAESRSVLVRTR